MTIKIFMRTGDVLLDNGLVVSIKLGDPIRLVIKMSTN